MDFSYDIIYFARRKVEIKKKLRTADVEPVFAHIKSNRNFKRFTHKGIDKAALEFGLHAIAHNLKKLSA